MSIDDMLECPVCRNSDIELQENTPVCSRCGYRVSSVVPGRKDDDVTILNALPQLALEMTKGFAIARSFLHVCVRRFVKPLGIVLDLGSGKNPSYLTYLSKYDYRHVKADGNPANNPDLLINLEERFPIKDDTFDSVLLFNVLEHVYDYENTISEIVRILKKQGTMYLFVPFLIKIHGSPYDYFRYTHNALRRLLANAGFSEIEVWSEGGLFKFLPLLFNWSSALLVGYVLYPLYLICCAVDTVLGKLTKGKYQKSFPVGYFIRCVKP